MAGDWGATRGAGRSGAARRIAAIALCAVVALWTCCASAALSPYTPDADTLQLWHLDESTTPCVNAAPGGTNLTSLTGGATLGHPSFPDFGTALSTLDGGQSGTSAASLDALLSARPLVNGSGDNTAMAFTDPVSGAFTFEAIVRVDFDPALNLGPAPAGTGRNSSLQIISGDGDATADRLFQFRLNPVGVGSGDTTVPRLEFINIPGGIQTVLVAIPANGPNAITSNEWYHVAVTYNGSQGSPDNLRFYWTLLEGNAPSANLIGSTSLNVDLPAGVACDFVIGNEGRATGGSSGNFLGLIDEVRISRVARAATNFFWQPPPPVDDDHDGLPDAWEVFYFTSITAYAATNDPDGDLFDNGAEYLGGSNPTHALSTPLDTDADGLLDGWEQAYFSSLHYGAGDDPDNDGFSNAQELAAGTHPNHAASHPDDIDADSLPDAWETTHFGSLEQAPGNDPDGDFFTNLQEYLAGTNPNSAASFPPGPQVRFLPIDDGNSETSEYGYAGSSSINAVCFTRESLMTVGHQQFIAWYYRHQSDASDPGNNRIAIGRRDIRTNIWEVYRTLFTANNITDGHDTASFGIDGEGFMHLSWGMHGDAFHYARSTHPVTGDQPIGFGPDTTMTGAENSVTYPQFLTMPNGDLLYLFREGGSGSGDTYLNRWSLATHSWTNVHYSGGQRMFLKGRGSGWSPDYNAYPNMPQLDRDGNFHLVWTWRYNSDSPAGEAGYQTNHDFDYARSTNGGLIWLRQDGTPYTLPINERGENGDPNSIAEKILSIPEGHSLINQAGMCLDSSNRPVIASWWAPGTGTNDYRRQYMVAFPDENNVWQVRQVSDRTNDPPGTKYSETHVRHLGRPVVLADAADRLIVVYRDNFRSNGLTVAFTPPRARDPLWTNWSRFDLTTENLGNYETQIDLERWKLDNVLHVLYQPTSGQGYTPPANTADQISVLEWNATAFFAQRPKLRLSLLQHTDAVLRFNAQPGWVYRVQTSVDLNSWETLATLSGVAWEMEYTHTNGVGAASRFWRVQSQEGGF